MERDSEEYVKVLVDEQGLEDGGGEHGRSEPEGLAHVGVALEGLKEVLEDDGTQHGEQIMHLED